MIENPMYLATPPEPEPFRDDVVISAHLLEGLLEIARSAYACPEWLRSSRTEETDRIIEEAEAAAIATPAPPEDPTDDAPDHDFELDAIRDWEDEHGR